MIDFDRNFLNEHATEVMEYMHANESVSLAKAVEIIKEKLGQKTELACVTPPVVENAVIQSEIANVSINKVVEDCPIVTEKVNPEIGYDRFEEFRLKLHQPELFIIFDLLNCEIRRSPKQTDRVRMMIHLRKKIERRLIGHAYSCEPFDRRVTYPLGGAPEKKYELIVDRAKNRAEIEDSST
jgi:methyl coenzyme M reductase subunit C-like uncharacterized protein (methanogenesis marker protein 7)